MPASDLAALVDDERPDVVALSTAVADNLNRAEEVIRRLAALEPRPFVAVGGRAWAGIEDRAREFGADVCARDADDLTRLLAERFPPMSDDAA